MRCSDRSTASGERRPPVTLPLGRGTLWRRLMDQAELFPPAVDGLHVSAVWSAATGWRLTVTSHHEGGRWDQAGAVVYDRLTLAEVLDAIDGDARSRRGF